MIEYNSTEVMNLNFANVRPFEFTYYYIEIKPIKASVYWIKIKMQQYRGNCRNSKYYCTRKYMIN